MSDLGVLTLDTWVQMKRRYTPILIVCAADQGPAQTLADRMNEAQQQVGTGGLPARVEVNDLIPAGFAFFKPPKYSPDGTWPIPEHEHFKIVRLYEQGQPSTGVQEGAAASVQE